MMFGTKNSETTMKRIATKGLKANEKEENYAGLVFCF